jgi:anti-sigma factor ChrR (cupin superfamily)
MHPDSDALSAFAEGALAEHERLACLDHLASCAECRQIVYLTQAAEAGETEPVKEPKPEAAPFWQRWLKPMPVLSTAAAAALVVFSIVVYRHQTPPPPQPELMAKAETPPAPVATPAMEKAAPPEAVRPKAAPAKESVP